MQEIAIHLWCDLCAADDDGARVEAATYPVADAAGLIVMVELCEPHASKLVGPVVDLAVRFGHPPERARTAAESAAVRAKVGPAQTAAGGYVASDASVRHGRAPSGAYTSRCLSPDHPDAVYASKSGLSAHYRKEHHGVVPGDVYGATCPVDGTRLENHGGLAGHAAKEHDRMTVSQLFDAARRKDSFGIVADAVARLAAIDRGLLSA